MSFYNSKNISTLMNIESTQLGSLSLVIFYKDTEIPM